MSKNTSRKRRVSADEKRTLAELIFEVATGIPGVSVVKVLAKRIASLATQKYREKIVSLEGELNEATAQNEKAREAIQLLLAENKELREQNQLLVEQGLRRNKRNAVLMDKLGVGSAENEDEQMFQIPSRSGEETTDIRK